MKEEIKVGDTVLCIKETRIKHDSYFTEYIREKEYGKKLKVSKVVYRFGKQYLFFEDYRPLVKERITMVGGRTTFETKAISLEASRFIKLETLKQEELDI